MDNNQGVNEKSDGKSKLPQKRTRSPYLFPAYDFTLARQIAEKVEQEGGGSLSEETLAVSLHLSTKSSGFQIKTLTARQFGLMTKSGPTLSTTGLAKAIFKPTNEDERKRALIQSFLEIPLFREVASRYKGQPLPQGVAFRNVLERELGIESKRVPDAERVLLDSARATGVLVTSGSNTYLYTDTGTMGKTQTNTMAGQPVPHVVENSPLPLSSTSQEGNVLPIIGEEDLLLLDKEQFQQFWGAYGEILRARAKRGQGQREVDKEQDKK